MKRVLRRIVLLATVVAIAGLGVFGQPGSNDSLVFPEIEGWEKGDRTTYPKPELGYSVGYKSSAGGTVTVYVYNGGIKNLSDSLTDRTVVGQMNQAKKDIHRYGELGYYDDVKEIKSETVKLGGASGTRESLYSLFNLKIRGTEATSEVYLFTYKKNFIKIRATRRKDLEGVENKAVASLMSELDRLFSD